MIRLGTSQELSAHLDNTFSGSARAFDDPEFLAGRDRPDMLDTAMQHAHPHHGQELVRLNIRVSLEAELM